MDTDLGYQILKKVTEDEDYCNAMATDCKALLSREGITEQDDIVELSNILSVYIKARIASTKDSESMRNFLLNQRNTTGETANTFKEGLRKTVKQIDSGFRITAVMYQVSFYLGIVLILSSVAFAFLGKGSLLPIVFAGFGVADVVTFFITNPPLQLQRSRADLAQLQLAFYNWFNDHFNWNASMAPMNTLTNPNEMYECMKKYSDAQLESVNRTMKLIETYCEFGSVKKGEPSNEQTSGSQQVEARPQNNIKK